MAKQDGIKRRKRQQSDRARMKNHAQEKKLHQRWYCYPTITEAAEQNRRVLQERERPVRVAVSDKYEDYWNRFYSGRI